MRGEVRDALEASEAPIEAFKSSLVVGCGWLRLNRVSVPVPSFMVLERPDRLGTGKGRIGDWQRKGRGHNKGRSQSKSFFNRSNSFKSPP